MRARSLRFWALVALPVHLATWAILLAFDVIPAGNGEVIDDGHVPGFVYVVLFVFFWASIAGLVAIAAKALISRVRRTSP